ncbi:unnamed protein product [Sphagnum jensenii]|uniref:Uncharacterized protein n=1 Tax=Sphagnum jensenii TaxID=128206 RepID=A0ABP1BPH8_9BRYO
MEDNEGRELLQMSHAQFMETVRVCETEIGFCSTNCFGKQTYTLHVQACLECDQEYEFTIDVKEAVDDAEDGKKPMDE